MGRTSNLRRTLETGQMVRLDAGYGNSSCVEVVGQTPAKLFTTVKCVETGATWDVMTYRLTEIEVDQKE